MPIMLRIKAVPKLPAKKPRTSKFAAHYAAAAAGKIVVLPKGASRNNPTIRRLGLTAALRDGRLYIFKPKRTSRRRSK